MSIKNKFLATDKKIIGDIYTSTEVMDNLIILCDDFGSRFTGTEGEGKAVEFIKQKFESYNLTNVHLEPVEYLGWRRGNTKLEIIAPIQKEIPCISLPHSPQANLKGTIFDMGDGHPDDFDRHAESIKGKIVMTTSVTNPNGTSRWIHRSEKYKRSLLAGAIGFIFVNHYQGYGPATGEIGINNNAGPIPGVSICKEDATFIQRLMKRKGEITLHLSSTDQCEPMTSWNIIGDIVGQKHPDDVVMLGSHYDGHDIAQGAIDPASGVVVVLETARILAKHATELDCTVRFALWCAEEIGLLGSTAYTKTHADDLDNIRFYLNMDSCGHGINDIVLNEWAKLQPYFENYAQEMIHDFVVEQSLHTFSDHYPFFMEGVPTGSMTPIRHKQKGRGYGHTMYDTVDKVPLPNLHIASALASRLALRVACQQNFPVSRRTQESVITILNANSEYHEEQLLQERINAFVLDNVK